MRRGIQHPARAVPLAFLLLIAVGTVVLMLPVARAGGGAAPVVTALFTAAGASCGALAVVDTATYWSAFGKVVVLLLMQVGGLGIMTLATLLGLLVSRRLGLRTRIAAQSETNTLSLGDVRTVLRGIAITTASVEGVAAVIIAGRLALAYDFGLLKALWFGVFHAVSAFCNAGYALFSDNLMGFVADPWISITVAVASLIGGLGFPVVIELWREWRRPTGWTIHTKLTVLGTAILTAGGMLLVLAFEWTNRGTFGPLSVAGKLVAAFFASVTPRTAGFNSIDYAAATHETLAVTDGLMFIGAGSAGTGGGIKLTTFFLLGFVIWAEIRGEPDVTVFHRRVGSQTIRQALTVALLGVGLVAMATMALLMLTDHSLDVILFECLSAFGSAGMSAGVTSTLSAPAQVVLVILMYVGRVGTISVATALALRNRPVLYRLPKERPIVG
ncbi:TrkH family potassium uptake protein [Flindersiella endophytica]